MTAEEIIKEIKENNLQEEFFEYSGKYLTEKYIQFKEIEKQDVICNSDEMYAVIFFKDYNIYIKIEGEYDSYGEGNHFYKGSIKEVFPKQVTITKYE